MRLCRSRCGLILLLLWSVTDLDALPVVESVHTNHDTVSLFEKFELTAQVQATYDNAYDFDQVNVRVTFAAPSGRLSRIDGFQFQNFRDVGTTLRSEGLPVWKARFAPNEAGLWHFDLTAHDASGTTSATSGTFICRVGDDPGFVRSTGGAYLRFDDSTQYFAIGENMGWGSSRDPVADFRHWLDDLSTHGGNYIRTWMASWGFAVEWLDTGLGNYESRQHRAFQLDQVVDHARRRGVYMQLVLNNHGQVSTRVNPEWDNNPYNAANGGPCEQTWDFFTDGKARNLFKRRLRYIVARWGYSPHILAWELFNEVDLTDSYQEHADDIAQWHREMAAELVSLDINGHLVTTSFSGGGSRSAEAMWNIDDLDLTQHHYYALDDDALQVQRELILDHRQSFDKPGMIGEFCFTDAGTARSSDPDGVYLHNSLWASAFSGAMGTAAIWWWDNYVAPLDLYFHFRALSAFFADLDLLGDDFQPRIVRAGSASAEDLMARPGIGLRRASVAQFEVAPSGVITPSPVRAGRYLFGVEDVDRRNPPTFLVDYAQAGEFHILTGTDISGRPRLTVWLDGVMVFDEEAGAESTHVTHVPVGTRAIRVENSGSGYVRVVSYAFVRYQPTVLSFALQGKHTMAGWLQNRKYNWNDVLKDGPPVPVEQATLSIGELELEGRYSVRWSDPLSGELLRSDQVVSIDGMLILDTPAFTWDLAYKIRYLGADTAVAELAVQPEEFALSHNYPNPFNSDTVIRYRLPQAMHAELHIRDLLGQRVTTLVAGMHPPGWSQITWRGTDDGGQRLSSGIYFCELIAGSYHTSSKVALLK